jgi:nitroreductase
MAMTTTARWPLTHDEIGYLVATASRAPSLHNSQPWRFRARGNVIELHADRGRNLRITDPGGREMLISCGAALYGLRLGLRKLGYRPVVEMLPDPAEPGLLARVQPGDRAPITVHERDLLMAVPHRHTHRGPFAPGRVPPGLLAGLGRDANAEGAALVLIGQPDRLRILSELAVAASHEQQANPAVGAELRRWTRPPGSPARDGVPAWAWAAPAVEREDEGPRPDRLPQRDFGGPGLLPSSGPAPSATAVLTTPGDTPADALRAGQALHRVLLHAATRWVFASLHTQPLELPPVRAKIRVSLALDGVPQMLMQFGRANTAAATARRPAGEFIER